MSYELLQEIWGCLLIVLAAGYAVLDGFDWGTGALYLFAKKDTDRRLLLNAIGPVWDGNAVWLVTFGGAMFGAFPHTYATIFSTFYIPLMVLLFALIFRAVSMEFRSKKSSPLWRNTWDVLFSLASIVAPLILGVALGNMVQGIPLDENYDFRGSLLDLLSPYALLLGVTTLALFMMHGSIYLALKTEGDLQNRVRHWVQRSMIFFIICYFTTTMATLIYMPHMVVRIQERPIFFLIGIFAMLAVANIPREISKHREGRAFLSSSCAIVLLMGLFALGSAPDLVRSTLDTGRHSLSIYNSSSSYKTLKYLLIIACIGMPIVLTYTTVIYRVFSGKVSLDDHSY